MNEEIEDIKATLDLLIARSAAQEMLLMYLARQMPRAFHYQPPASDVQDLRHALASTPLTDPQLALVDQELRRMSSLLRQNLPADEAPF